MTVIAKFTIHYTQFLNHNGEVVKELPAFAHDKNKLIDFYRMMLLSRTLDHKAVALQRTGRMGTYPEAVGQEAFSTGIAKALNSNDVFASYYRDHFIYYERNVSPINLFQYWGGDERGMDFKENKEDLPVCIPIATQCLHAAGIATAIKLRNEKRAVLVTLGDGATSKGDFYEAMNIAGVWHLPLVFVINNNQWAISVPRSKQCAAETLAQKAIAAGFTGEQVDGNDVIAVHHAVGNALEKARHGKGPHLIEAMTFRLCNHTTADDATRYIPEEASKQAWKNEPLIRLQKYLQKQHGWTDQEKEIMEKEIQDSVDNMINDYLKIAPQAPETMFDFLFANLPDPLQEQRQELIESLQYTTQDDKNG